MMNLLKKCILVIITFGTYTLHGQYDLIVRNCNVLTPQGEIQKNRDIIIHDRKFIDIQNSGTTTEQASNEIQAHSMIAMPGLINTHAHTAMSLFRGVAEDVPFAQWWFEKIKPLEAKLNTQDVYWGTMLGLAQMIQSGITTVADHYFFMDSVAQAFSQAGVRGILGQAIFDFQGDQALEETRNFIHQWHKKEHERILTVVAPHAPYTCNPNFLAQAASLAQELGVGIHLHASESEQQVLESDEQYGKTPIEILHEVGILRAQAPVILAHGCGLLESDILLLQDYPSVGIACASKTYGKLAMGHTPVYELLKHGIKVGLATDGAASNNSYDLFEVMRLMAMDQKNNCENPEIFSAKEVLHIATQGGAAVVGLQEKIGQIAPGFCADMILVDLNGLHHQPVNNILTNLVYNTIPTDVQTVIIDGKIVMLNKEFLTFDVQEVIRNAQESITRLLS